MALSDTDTRARSSADPTVRAAVPATLNAVDWLALVLMIVGGLNWGLVGLLNLDLVATIFGDGSMLSRIVYALVGLAAVWGIVLATRLGAARR